jgi:hypothetical protein
MPTYTLTVLDTPGIQQYIFGSNRLRENIGASELVRRASMAWPLQILHKMGHTNINDPLADDPTQWLDDGKHIENTELLAEVVYVGGGNTVILFHDEAQAKAFVTNLSHQAIEEAPGLDLAAVHVPVDWRQDCLGEKVREAMRQLMRYKQSRRPSTPLLSLGVTVAGQSTGLPATTNAAHGKPKDEPTYPISDATAAKLEAVPRAKRRLEEVFPQVVEAKHEFATDFDDFGRSREEMSYIAVVHADGNGMGDFFRQIADKHTDSRAYIQAVRSASISVSQAAGEAFRRAVTTLLSKVSFDERGEYQIAEKIPMPDGKLPFRPLVFGGDDVTFVCDGRLGLSLAALYLRLFEDEAQKRSFDLHACAGVAVVKTHYPFARAYRLSEALASNAKQHVRAQHNGDFSALDWHFAAGGLLGSISKIRGREYAVKAGKLHVRPLQLRDGGDWRTWPNFRRVVTTLQRDAEKQRNKVIALRKVLREGPEAVERFLPLYGKELPRWNGAGADMQAKGWYTNICGYFDPIEALDFYVPLEE